MDLTKMEAGFRTFLEGVGERFPGDDLDRTPERAARAWAEELVAGYRIDPEGEMAATPAPEGAGVVIVRDVRFASICVHHLLPFVGLAQIAYLPAHRLAGLSKIGRVVEAHARRLQIQERLTAEILGTLVRALDPVGAIVLLEAEHTCMTLRGAKKETSRLVTVATSGIYHAEPSARSEVLELMAPRGTGLSSSR